MDARQLKALHLNNLQNTIQEVEEWLLGADQQALCEVCLFKNDCPVCGAGPQQYYLPACSTEDTLYLPAILFEIEKLRVAAKYKL